MHSVEKSAGDRRRVSTVTVVLGGTILIVAALVSSLRSADSKADLGPPNGMVAGFGAVPSPAGTSLPMTRSAPPIRVAESAAEPAAVLAGDSQVPSTAAPQTAGCETCPSGRQRSFDFLRRLCRSQPFSIEPDICMPSESWRLLSDRVEQHQSALKPLTDAMDPILEEIVDARVRSGQVEHFAHPDSFTAKEDQVQARKAWKAANRPNRPGQRVVSGGEGGKLFLVRVDPGDDPRYGSLVRQHEDMTLEFLHRLAVEIHPYLRFERETK